MMNKWLSILILSLLALTANAAKHIPDTVYHHDRMYVDGLRIYSDSAIYQGLNLKIDMFMPILEVARSKGKLQAYEMALNLRLKRRYYPTIELGYAFGETNVSDTYWKGQGGFVKLGLDINGLRKHVDALDALLVGIRVGGAYEKYDLTGVRMAGSYWQPASTRDFINQYSFNCWGEVVTGCQVHVYSGLMMGWYFRLKVLFTRKLKGEEVASYYIPGFGYRDNTNWGFNYYIGWKF